jgi:HlyD family secretion protein
MKTRSRALLISGAVAVVVVLAAVFVLRPLFSGRDGVSYVTRPVGYADISASVNETGTVNPVNQVQVGSEVSGTIRSLSVDYNSKVRKGQVLATLDPTTYQAAVDSARANLQLVQASLDSAQVNVGKAKALLDMANLTVQRDEPLVKQGLINQNQLDNDHTAAVTAQLDYLSAQAGVRVAEAQVAVSKGQLEQTQFNLSKTVIVSPFDGIVMARNVSIGQTVAASLQTPTLFTLATNLTDMQVDTSVDEADVGSVREGQAARITVTAFPNVIFEGTVLQVRINPTVVQNVVTYDAVVQVHDTSGRLLPGMTAQVTIEIGKRQQVLAVPIAAVLYRPITAQPAAGGFGAGGFGAGVVQSTGTLGGSAVAGAPGSQVTVWVLQNGRPTPVQVVIGLTDGKNIEISNDGLRAGDLVVIAQRRGSGKGTTSQGSGAGTGTSASGGGRSAPSGSAPAASVSGSVSGSIDGSTGNAAAGPVPSGKSVTGRPADTSGSKPGAGTAPRRPKKDSSTASTDSGGSGAGTSQ